MPPSTRIACGHLVLAYMQVTPFERRVERKLAEEEEVMKQQQQHEGQH